MVYKNKQKKSNIKTAKKEIKKIKQLNTTKIFLYLVNINFYI